MHILDRLMMIFVFGGTVASVYGLSMLSTPRRGLTKVLERLAGGVTLCLICYVLLSPFGITVPQTPFSALCASCLGIPGVVFSTFLSIWP